MRIPTIVLAPMAGGPATVALACAVNEAGGLGFLAGAYLTPADLAAQIDELRATTESPFGVNLFLLRDEPIDSEAVARYVASLDSDARQLDVTLGEPRFDDDGFDAKLEILVASPVPFVSFTFGCPSPEIVAALQAVGTRVWATVTTVEEAELVVAAGCDAVIAQGGEAGGHRSSFVDDGGEDAVPTLELVADLAAAIDRPIIAAGGIATADDVAAALGAGAAAVQCGTAFLLADEAGTHPLHRAAVAMVAPTAFTRAFTGRTARGVINEFMRAHEDAPVAFPHLHYVTAPLRAAARAAGDADRVNLWAGAAHSCAQAAPALEIVRSLLTDPD